MSVKCEARYLQQASGMLQVSHARVSLSYIFACVMVSLHVP